MYSNRRDNRARGGAARADLRRLSPAVLMLLSEIWFQLERLPVKPMATVALLLANIGVYLSDFSNSRSRTLYCLNASEGAEVKRLIISGFLHADDRHLYYNMTSLLWKGSQLEPQLGTVKFSALCCYSLFAAHFLYIIISTVLLNSFDYPDSYYSCAVGFSAVLFSLKYVLNAKSPTLTTINGMTLPLRHACWLELVLASLVSANVSFVGHLAGIIAGVIWVHCDMESWIELLLVQ